MRKLIAICLVAGLLLAAGGTAQAAVTVLYDAGTTNVTTALTGFGTTGAMMDGMNVTAWYGSGPDTQTWADTVNAGEGAAVGTDWSLTELGDTYGGTWTLTNDTGSALTQLLIDAGPGDTVFDTWGNSAGTAGSAYGWAFDVTSDHSSLDITATYIDLVALTGDDPVGDLYRRLDIDFGTGGLPSGSSLTFRADTDNILFAGDLTPIPAPGAILLGGIGLGLVGWLRRRRTL